MLFSNLALREAAAEFELERELDLEEMLEQTFARTRDKRFPEGSFRYRRKPRPVRRKDGESNE